MRVVGAAFFAAGLLVVPLASAASFGRQAEIPLVRAPVAVAVADPTQDGMEDLVVANAAGPTLTVLPGKQDGSFERPVDIRGGPAAQSLALADLDNDGVDDVAIAGGAELAIYLGAGGTFVRRTTLTTPFPSTVIATDLDVDGNYDLVAAGTNRAVVTVFMGTGDGTFLSGRDYATFAPPTALLPADLNGDELPDIAVAGSNVSLLFGNGDGTLGGPVTLLASREALAITGADLDDDGDVDLAVARRANFVDLLFNAGDGQFPAGNTVRVGGTPVAIGVTYIDDDSTLDLVTANRGTSDLSILLGLEDGQFRPEERVKVGKAPVALAIQDLNADGVDDIASANGLAKSVTVLLNGADAPQPVVCLVPRVAKRKLAVARRLVDAAHCKVATVRRKYSGRIKKGRVISITPVPGTRRPVDTPITLLVSRGHKPRR